METILKEGEEFSQIKDILNPLIEKMMELMVETILIERINCCMEIYLLPEIIELGCNIVEKIENGEYPKKGEA